MSQASRGVGAAPGGSGETHMAQRGGDDAERPVRHDSQPPELAGFRVANHDRALDIFAGVVALRVAAADIDERREHAAWRCGK